MDPQWQAYFENIFENKLSGIKESIVTMDQKMDRNMEVMNQNLSLISEEVKGVKQLQIKQGVEIENMKKEERSTNLIFHGLKQENYQDTLDKICEVFNSVGIKGSKYLIRYIRRLGNGNWNDKPILVSLISGPLKIDVLKNKKRVSELYPGITIKDDMTKETRGKRSQLHKYSELAMTNNIKVYMRGDKLIIHGKPLSIEELQKDSNNSFLNKQKRGREEDSSPNKGSEKKGTTYNQQLKRVNSLENFVIKMNNMDTTEGTTNLQTVPATAENKEINK